MTWIDWMIVILPVTFCVWLAFYTRRFTRSVADFLAGGRHAGRYMLATARGEHASGSLGMVAQLQIFLTAGYTVYWWLQINIFVTMLVAASGFVIYRYRQTRAMTVAQFFEMRYSRRFRLFAGALAFFAGLVNFGIGTIVVARFFVYFLEIPPVLHAGGLAVSTELVFLAALIGLGVVMAVSGGQVAVLLTDCVEGMITLFLYVIIVGAILLTFFHWPQVHEILVNTEPGRSYVDPFDTFKTKNFNLGFVLMAMFIGNTSILAFQYNHAFNSSAINPQESRMGVVLGNWRNVVSQSMTLFLGLCALAYFQSAQGNAAVKAVTDGIADPNIAKQMNGPISLSHMLPMGAKGALLASALMGTIATLEMHMHSWSSIFIQDVILPLRKTPLTAREHLRYLRLGVLGLGIWGFAFGALFPSTDYLPLWFAITQAIFTSGAGIAIMGGLYWSRGTTTGAWTSLILGAVITVGGMVFNMVYTRVYKQDFVLNHQHFAFIGTAVSMLAYIVVSYLTCRQPHNMDKLLHRGAYAVAADALEPGKEAAAAPARPAFWKRFLRLSDDIPVRDRWVTAAVSGWGLLWFVVLLFVVLWYALFGSWTKETWAHYWLVTAIIIPILIGALTTVWFTWGCSHDIKVFFHRLKTEKVDETDDGRVEPSGH